MQHYYIKPVMQEETKVVNHIRQPSQKSVPEAVLSSGLYTLNGNETSLNTDIVFHVDFSNE